MSDNNEEGSIAQDTSTGQSARTWSLTNLQTRFPRSAVDMAQELLPNLPRHIFSRNSATPVRATTLPTAFAMTSPSEHGSVVVDLSEMEARDGPQEVAGTINSQVSSSQKIFFFSLSRHCHLYLYQFCPDLSCITNVMLLLTSTTLLIHSLIFPCYNYKCIHVFSC